jgi:hypothetical protein
MTTNISNALIIAVESTIVQTLLDVLFSSMVCLKTTEKQLKQQLSRNIVTILLHNYSKFFCVTDLSLF